MKLWTGNDDVSHVGILMKGEFLPEHPSIDPDTWYVLETTASGRIAGCYNASPVVDVVTGRGRLGTQVRPLLPVVETYEGSVYLGPLNDNPTVQKEKESDEDYAKRMQELKDRMKEPLNRLLELRYNVSVWDCFYALCSCCRCCHCCANQMICSQLVGEILQELGVIEEKYDPRTMLPVDFLAERTPDGDYVPVDNDGMPGLVNEDKLIRLPLKETDSNNEDVA